MQSVITRNEELIKHEIFDVNIWLQNCIVKNKSIDEVDEFLIVANCQKDRLFFDSTPFMICGEAMDEMANLLSEQSLDIINNRTRDIVGLPPGFSETLKSRRIIVI